MMFQLIHEMSKACSAFLGDKFGFFESIPMKSKTSETSFKIEEICKQNMIGWIYQYEQNEQYEPFQLQEYQTDMWRCRFDTPGKLTPAHSVGAPTARGLWVAPGRWEGAELTAAGPPTAQGTISCPWAVGGHVICCGGSPTAQGQ